MPLVKGGRVACRSNASAVQRRHHCQTGGESPIPLESGQLRTLSYKFN